MARVIKVAGAVKGKQKTIKVTSQPRQDKKPRPTAFQPGNPHRFKSRAELGGELDPRIDPAGRKASETTLLSKNMLVALNNRAPDAVTQLLELPKGSSWSQCLATFILRKAFKEDSWEAAIRLIASLTENNGRNSMQDELEAMRRQLAQGGGGGPKMSVIFVESDGSGRISEKSLEELAAIEKHQQEISDLALSDRTINGDLGYYDN